MRNEKQHEQSSTMKRGYEQSMFHVLFYFHIETTTESGTNQDKQGVKQLNTNVQMKLEEVDIEIQATPVQQIVGPTLNTVESESNFGMTKRVKLEK